MQIITLKKTLFIAVTSLGLSSLAYADELHPQNDLSHDMSFVKADSDQDGALTRTEFEIFVALKASQDIDNYPAIKDQSLEHAIFSAKDLNSDGLLTTVELAQAASLPELTPAVDNQANSSVPTDSAPTDTAPTDNVPAATPESHGS